MSATPSGTATRPRAGRGPVHPGYLLDTRYLKPLGLTQLALAEALGISRRRVNELVRGRRGMERALDITGSASGPAGGRGHPPDDPARTVPRHLHHRHR